MYKNFTLYVSIADRGVFAAFAFVVRVGRSTYPMIGMCLVAVSLSSKDARTCCVHDVDNHYSEMQMSVKARSIMHTDKYLMIKLV